MLESPTSKKQFSLCGGPDLDGHVIQAADHDNDISGEEGDELREITINFTAFE